MSAYVYPFGPKTTTGRIDQGQDFGGSGPVRAIGNAKIVKTSSPWPEYEGGAGILYQLLDGPHRGRYVYVYEGVKSLVHPGQVVPAGSVIGQIIPGTSTGIETGWAGRDGQPLSRAEYVEGKETKVGKSFAAFLQSLALGHGPGPNEGFQVPMSPAERSKIAKIGKEENLGESVLPNGSELASEVLSGIVGDLGKSAEPLMLNIGLLGGGAFLIYYGIALMSGSSEPTLKLFEAMKKPAEEAAA